MTRETLDHLAMPHTTSELARQALIAARRRRLQMIPENAPRTAPGEDVVAHYQGPSDEIELRAEPWSLADTKTIRNW